MFRTSMMPIVLAFCFCLWSKASGSEPDEPTKPNVVIIMADDLGYGDLSSYGATDLKSPHIDGLVTAGMRFDFAYANCPVCSPSRASLMTGRYPELVGVPGVIRTHQENNWGYLAPDAILLPEILKSQNYHTALIGKWHLGLEAPNRPNDRGFDFFHGYLGDMMDDYYTHRRHGINYMVRDTETIDPQGHATDLFSQWACQYIESRVDQPNPFCLCLTYNAPHTPIQPPVDWLEKVRLRQPEISEKRAKLVALIEHMDHGIGQVMSTLRQTELSANTIVIFTSDNGGHVSAGANNGKTRNGKGSVYEGGIRVPTCIVWPGKIAAETRCDQRIATMDFLPTICDAAGASFDHRVDGISLLPILTGKQGSLAARDLFFIRREGGMRYGGLPINALVRGNWKLLQNSPFAKQELYDLENDPLEQKDLAKFNPKVFRELATILRAHVQRGGQIPWQKPAQ